MKNIIAALAFQFLILAFACGYAFGSSLNTNNVAGMGSWPGSPSASTTTQVNSGIFSLQEYAPTSNSPLSMAPGLFTGANVDLGQYLQFNFSISGGNPPYNAMLEYAQPSGQAGNTPVSLLSGNSESLEIVPLSENTLQVSMGSSSANITTANAIYGQWSFNVIITDSSGGEAIGSIMPGVGIYPALHVITNYNSSGYYYNKPFPAINITYGQSYAFNALNTTQITGGTGKYHFNWTSYYTSIPPNGIELGNSCNSGLPTCTVTDAASNHTEQGTLAVLINDTSDGISPAGSVQNIQYYFITANPAPSAYKDWLGRNITRVDNPRIGILLPSIGQIIYSLGLGSDVVGISSISKSTLSQYGVNANASVADLGDYFTIPDFTSGLIASGANYVPIDSGAFYSSLTSGISDLSQANITAVALGGDFDYNISQVESDIMLVANTTGRTQRGYGVVNGMNRIIDNVTGAVAGLQEPTVAMLSYYDYGVLYVDGNQSFIGSEISMAGGKDVYPGFYPSPSAESLLAANPNVIIASIFINNITNTSQLLDSIPGIEDTNAWKDGQVYILGNLSTNITDEPGPLAAYGIEIYGMILHPGAFGFNSSAVPRNITDQWVEQHIRPNLFGIAGSQATVSVIPKSSQPPPPHYSIANFTNASSTGYEISDMMQGLQFNLTLPKGTLNIIDDYNSNDKAILSVNDTAYTLAEGVPQQLTPADGHVYYIKLLNVSHVLYTTAEAVVYTQKNPIQNIAAKPTTVYANPSAGALSIEIPGNGSINVIFNGSASLLINSSSPYKAGLIVSLLNMDADYGQLGKLAGYVPLSIINASVNTTANVTILLTFMLGNEANRSSVHPYELLNGKWAMINNFHLNASSGTISIMIQKDPIIGLFYPAFNTTGTTQSTSSISTTIPNASSSTLLTTSHQATISAGNSSSGQKGASGRGYPGNEATQKSQIINIVIYSAGIFAVLIAISLIVYYYIFNKKGRKR